MHTDCERLYTIMMLAVLSRIYLQSDDISMCEFLDEITLLDDYFFDVRFHKLLKNMNLLSQYLTANKLPVTSQILWYLATAN